MTKRQKMFYEIAEAFARTPEERAEKEGSATRFGLCGTYDRLKGTHNNHFKNKAFHLGNALHWCPVRDPQINSDYDYQPHLRIHDLWRADFAVLMSVMSDEDYNRIVGE